MKRIYNVGRQQPKTHINLVLDGYYKARLGGKRKSKSGKIYYEYRGNRTDRRKSNI